MRSPALLVLISIAATASADEPPLAVEPPSAKAIRNQHFELHRSVGYLTAAAQVGALLVFALDDGARFNGHDGSHAYVIPEIALGSLVEVGVVVNYLLAATAPASPGGTTARNVIHQTLMYAAAATNVARVIIAVMLAGATGTSGHADLILAHRITAIASPLLFASGIVIQSF